MRFQHIYENRISIVKFSTLDKARDIVKIFFETIDDAAIYEELKMVNGRYNFSIKDRAHKNIFQLKQLE
jgi:hypothetical protein